MQTTANFSDQWAVSAPVQKHKVSLIGRWIVFEDTQAENMTLWYLVSMIVQGVFFLPVPAFLIYNFHAPVVILFATLGLFFANIIAGMGGLGIRAILSLFAASIATHALMILVYVI